MNVKSLNKSRAKVLKRKELLDSMAEKIIKIISRPENVVYQGFLQALYDLKIYNINYPLTIENAHSLLLCSECLRDIIEEMVEWDLIEIKEGKIVLTKLGELVARKLRGI